jgi:hypothetical protein
MPGKEKVDFPHEEFDRDFDVIDNIEEPKDVVVDLPENHDEFEVNVVDDTPEADKRARPLQRDVPEPTDDEMANYGQKARARIGELTHARHDERRKREALEREHNAVLEHTRMLHQENLNLRKAYTDGSAEYSKMSTASAEAEVAAARAKLLTANQTLDPDEVTAAQEALYDAKLKLSSAKEFRAPTVAQSPNVVQTQQQTQTEALDPKTKAWMAENSWFTNPRHVAETSYALGLHQEIVQDGRHASGSDGYYEQINARMKQRFPELYSSNDTAGNEPAPRRKAASPVAAVERTQSGKRRVTLTQSQVNLCKRLNITPQQYAAQLFGKGE